MITTVNVMSIPVFASWDLFNGFPKSLWGVVRLADFAVVVSVDFSSCFPVLVVASLDLAVLVSVDFSACFPVLAEASLDLEEEYMAGTEELFSSDVLLFCVLIFSLLLVFVVLTVEIVACLEVSSSVWVTRSWRALKISAKS